MRVTRSMTFGARGSANVLLWVLLPELVVPVPQDAGAATPLSEREMRKLFTPRRRRHSGLSRGDACVGIRVAHELLARELVGPEGVEPSRSTRRIRRGVRHDGLSRCRGDSGNSQDLMRSAILPALLSRLLSNFALCSQNPRRGSLPRRLCIKRRVFLLSARNRRSGGCRSKRRVQP